MMPNLQDYPKFYRWLTLPFTRKPNRVQALQRMNRILTLAMPVIYSLVFCWLFLKKTSIGGIWPFIWIPASGFVLLSIFRHWVNVPRPYEKWELQPLLEKNSSGHSFPSRHVFSATIISMCVCQLSLLLGMCSMLLSLLLAFVRVLGGVHYPKDVFAAWVLGLIWGELFLLL